MPTTTRRRGRPLAVFGILAAALLSACQPGWVNPFVGTGGAGTTTGASDDHAAALTYPTGVVAAPDGGFYVYDSGTCAIYREQAGTTTPIAGIPGTCGGTGDGGAATAATLDNSLAVDPNTEAVLHGPHNDVSTPLALGPDGSVYFVQVSIAGWLSQPGSGLSFPQYSSRIRKIDGEGIITTVGTPITASLTDAFTGLTATPDGTIFAIANHGTSSTDVDQINADGSQTTIATIDGLALGIAAISDTEVAVLTDSAVKRVDLTTGVATTTGYAMTSFAGSIAAAPDGTIYVGSTTGNRIDRISPDNTTAQIGGLLTGTDRADPGTTAQIGSGLDLRLTPTGLALTPNHGLLVSSGHVVYRLDNPDAVPPLVIGDPLNYFGGCPTGMTLPPTMPGTTAPPSGFTPICNPG